ncbi:glycosyltransferase family 2 protein [Achromobacter xylosoxidans]|uniref:MobA-like NTP transferase domain-containing protein n=1 Tax=Alcaligenes xylosoxydans xylosoxydans TaxID=85698 RepID=A0A424W953_ALCXX|nr:glycosyltransferase family 2 protein [Achromobacter xylosoxidans]MBC9906813.1 glycosyltransferase family 2 protein [Achromobacter xylosoxidans]MBD0870523.1 glycosyltransferase family 2 protein [Achromobacter xylosoxidans]QNP85760.1 glycosyltransferase family 2 protein [Achromobacter xylosoxidans]RPJ89755.1 hypothetical protein DY367_21285 [Achromobacter xylosoxidans]
MIVIITMAGMGKRFRDAGWDVPKYQIEAHGRTLFAWSMLSLRQFWKVKAQPIFIVQRQDQASEFIKAECARLTIVEPQIVEIDGLTDGQATTAMLGMNAAHNDNVPVFVYNIDTFVHPDSLAPENVRGDGWIPCFEGAGNGWSFARVDENMRVTEMREKERISNWATVGLYGFSSIALYRELYGDFFSDGQGLAKGERYIAPMYNRMLEQDKQVYVQPLPLSAVIPLGTPAELKQFLEAQPPVL